MQFLDAVNHVLSQVGAAPVSSLSANLPDLSNAVLRLEEASNSVQSQGWWFNRLQNVNLPAGIDNKIVLPENTIKLVSKSHNYVVNRQGAAYSPLFDTFEFPGGITVDIVLELDWDDLPDSVQNAVMYKASRQMVIHELEDYNKAEIINVDYQVALLQVKAEDLELNRRNAFHTPKILRTRGGVRPYSSGRSRINPVYPGGNI